MRIALDARWIFEQISGIGCYTRELIRELAHVDRENEYLLLFEHRHLADRTQEETGFNAAPNMQVKRAPCGLFSPRNQTWLRAFLDEHGARVYHAPNYMIPFFRFPRGRAGHIRCVTTIHDMIPLALPNHAPRSRKTRLFPLYRRLMKEVGARSDFIITVSDFSRQDTIRHLGIPPARAGQVVRVYNGVHPMFHPAVTPIEPGPQEILYVGRFDPYKQLVTLVEAFAQLRNTGLRARLRVIGPPDARYPEPHERARALGLDDAISWSGYISNEALRTAYQRASVFVLPSSYEGFGLPVLEAMACGTPVVCSNATSLPEVAGDAALLVEPGRPEPLAEAIRRALTDTVLADDLRHRGLHRAKTFTWKRAAQETVEVYRRADAL